MSGNGTPFLHTCTLAVFLVHKSSKAGEELVPIATGRARNKSEHKETCMYRATLFHIYVCLLSSICVASIFFYFDIKRVHRYLFSSVL